jgi:anhydro-N-acetylmuramic acid kinase
MALCTFENSGPHTSVEVTHFETFSFEEDFKEEIRQIFAKKEIDFLQLCVLHPWIGQMHGQIILQTLSKWNIDPTEVDCIASHGQTVFHAPIWLHGLSKFPNATLQIGDGDHIAQTTGILTLSDFRQKHCAAGGEGAPLAVYGDFLIFSQANENRILLNMGGIANFTFLPATLEPNDVFATDTGTGNTLLDAFVQKMWGIPYDKDAQLARQGTVSQPLLTQLKSHPFFQQSFPKTTGPELFNLAYLNEALQKIRETPTDQDILATLVQFSADTIVDAIEKMQYKLPTGFSTVLYASGGGMHNPLLMERIREQLAQFPILPLNDLGISGDAKEAVLFATLANEALVGGKTDFGTRQGVPSVSMGKISFPN